MGLTSAHWGVYEFAVKNGKITEMKPFLEDPDPSLIGPSIVDLLNDPMRITAPAVRESWLNAGPGSAPEKRGSDPFIRVGWDEAEKLNKKLGKASGSSSKSGGGGAKAKPKVRPCRCALGLLWR